MSTRVKRILSLTTGCFWLLVSARLTASANQDVVNEDGMKAWVTDRFADPAALGDRREGIVIEQSRLSVARALRPDNEPRVLKGEKVLSGLFMDAPARLRVIMSRPVNAFHAAVGLDENRDMLMNADKGSVRFGIETNNKEVAATGVLRQSDNGTIIEAKFDSAHEFTLIVNDGGDGFGWDQAVWANPTVTYDDGTTGDVSLLPFARDASELLSLPFSAKIDGMPIRSDILKWTYSAKQEKTTDSDRVRYSYTHPSGNLKLEFDTRVFSDHSAVDIIARVSNPGDTTSPLVTELMVVDTLLMTSESAAPLLRWSEGDKNHATAFMPHDDTLADQTSKTLAPTGGRSSNGILPFFNLHSGNDHGWIAAVGWTGQWTATFSNSDDQIRFKAGMERTNFRLLPNEVVRTPRMALLRYSGPMEEGHNYFRRLMIDRYLPKINGKPASPPIAHNVAATVWTSKKPATEKNQFAVIEKAAELGVEAYWMDAYYFPQFWYENVGNWFARPDDFPRGMKALGDKAHQEGMQFILWFEPERVHKSTQLDKEIPEHLISLPGSDDRLVKLHDPEAREFLTDFISDKIRSWGVDLYRQDFNMDPLAYWQSQDLPEREGITEMKYVEGLYDFWDELRRRFPGLTIDNTASGGRRIDLETMSRSYPLWRSDFNDIGEGLKGEQYWPQMGMAHQIHSSGLSIYFPYHSGPLWSMMPYNVRSAMTANIVLYDALLRDGFPGELAKEAIAEVKSLRPYLLGDYYVLLPFSHDQGDWFAWQYHRREEGDGFAVFFRRSASPYAEAVVPLHGIEEGKQYTVSWAYGYDPQPEQTMTGKDLLRLRVTLDEPSSSALLRYGLAGKRINASK